jgi:hypothetical protein
VFQSVLQCQWFIKMKMMLPHYYNCYAYFMKDLLPSLSQFSACIFSETVISECPTRDMCGNIS